MIRFIDLFCGCGGLSTGLCQAGWECAAGADVLEEELSTFHHAHPGALPLRLDLIGDKNAVDTVVKLARSLNINAVVGGPPCQDFSASGKNAGEDGKRNGFPPFLSVIEKFQPELFLFENVPGLIQGHAEYFGWIKEEVRRIGYDFAQWLLNAADYGVPQTRKRVFVVGVKSGIQLPKMPNPTHSKVGALGLPSWLGWGTVIDSSLPINKPATAIVKKHVKKWLENQAKKKADDRQGSLLVQQIGSGKAEACRVRSKGEAANTVLCVGDGRVDMVLVQEFGMSGFGLDRVTESGKGSPTVTADRGGRLCLVAQSAETVIRDSNDPPMTVTCGGANADGDSGGRPHLLVRLDSGNDGQEHYGDGCYPAPAPAPCINGAGGGPRQVLVSGKQGSEVFAPEGRTPGAPSANVATQHDDKLLVELPLSKLIRDIELLRQRHLTVGELAALQGFPCGDHPWETAYLFQGTLTAKRRQIGNAVPPPLAKAIGESVRKACGGNDA